MDADPQPEAILLCGPTASGKSDWALRLAAEWPVEIISVDSAQVYRGFDVGAAKPAPEVRAQVPHHLLDIREPEEPYNAGEFVADALAAIRDIRARGRIPLLVGGTMMYFGAFIRGLAVLPPADLDIRRSIDLEAARLGWPALHARLAGVDPLAAARMHVHDSQRIQRALEVYALSGKPMSDWHRATAPSHQLRLARWALVPAERRLLHARIAARFDRMMAEGFVEEVQGLRDRLGAASQASSLRAVGYRQLWEHLGGQGTLDEAVQRGIAATRQLAKRQLTWIQADPGWRRIDPFATGAEERWTQSLRELL